MPMPSTIAQPQDDSSKPSGVVNLFIDFQVPEVPVISA